MDKANIGWLAGIIDGEGNFTIRILFRETKTLGKRARFQPQLVIVNTRETLIDRVAEIYSELGIKSKKWERDRWKTEHPNWKKVYNLIIYSSGLRKLLPLIKPYCDKIDEIELLEKFLKDNTRKGSGNIYSNDELKEMETLRQRLIELHGTTATTLSTRMADECLLTEDEVREHDNRRLQICKRMETERLKNKKGDIQ